MDNAAKALLLAGGILIGVLLISVGMYMLTSFREVYSQNMNLLDSNRKNNFNSFLMKFNNNSTILGRDAWNILAYAKDASNDEYSFGYGIESTGKLNSNNFRKMLFFTESLDSSYNYQYVIGNDGVVQQIAVN